MRKTRANYDPVIATFTTPDACSSKLRRLGHVWAAGRTNQNRIHAVELGTRNLILDNVELTWVQELRNTFTFFTGVLTRKILDHISNHTGGLDRTAGVEVVLGINRLWESDPRVNQFIIRM